MKIKNILVVDDEDMVLKLCQRTLVKMGYKVTLTANMTEAQSKINSMNFDLLLTDWMLAEGDGIELLYQFNKTFPTARAIIMTGLDLSPTAIESARKLNSDHFLRKPFLLEELESAIHKVQKDN